MDRRTFGVTAASIVAAPAMAIETANPPTKDTQNFYKWYDLTTRKKYSDVEISLQQFHSDLSVTGKLKCRNKDHSWLTVPYFNQGYKPEELKHTPNSLAEMMRKNFGFYDRRRLYLKSGYPDGFLFCGADRCATADLVGRHMVFYFTTEPFKEPKMTTIKYFGWEGKPPQIRNIKEGD